MNLRFYRFDLIVIDKHERFLTYSFTITIILKWQILNLPVFYSCLGCIKKKKEISVKKHE